MRHQAGFSKILILIILGIVLLTVSGISLRDYAESPKDIANETQQVYEDAETTYEGKIKDPLHTYIIDPAETAWSYLKIYIIEPLREFLASLTGTDLNNPDIQANNALNQGRIL